MKIPEWLTCYGDQDWRGPCPPESAEQVTFFSWLRAQHPELGRIAIHPRNEGKRTFGQTARHKAEGMAPGASDIIIPGCPAFVCEMKRQDRTQSNWQDGQVKYLEAAKENGSFVCVALGWEGAKQAVEAWLKEQETS